MSTSSIQRGSLTGCHGSYKMRTVQAIFPGDTIVDDVEHMEPYGYSSEPFPDGFTDVIAVFTGEDLSTGVILNVADRRYRIADMSPGEVVLYDYKGRKVYLKSDGIEIDGASDPITVKTTGNIIINSSANVNITASGQTTINCPTNTVNGNLTVTGAIVGQGGMSISGGSGATVSGSLSTTGDITTDSDVVASGISLNSHTHTGDSGGNTSGPK